MKKIRVFATVTAFLAVFSQAQTDLLNLPLPADGTRYDSDTELEKVWPTAHGAGSVCLWGEDKFAAVSISIDDNNAPDIPFWREMSGTYGYKFTWFVIVYPYVWDVYNDVPGTNPSYDGTPATWQELAAEGQDIQLHAALEMNSLTGVAYEERLHLCKDWLSETIGMDVTCYAYPAGIISNTNLPNVEPNAYLMACSNIFAAARGGLSYSITKPALVDYLTIPSIGPVDSTSTYWPKFDQKNTNLQYSNYRGWGVCLFHKVADTNAVIDLLDYLQANDSKFWVKPFSHVVRYSEERDSATLVTNSVSADQITFTLTDQMTNSYYTIPLTVKFRVDNWGGASAVQSGQAVPVSLITHSNNTYALVDAVPDRGPVTLSKAGSASFTATPVSGWAPLQVSFSDISTLIGVTNRFWDFGDGTTTNVSGADVTHTYFSAGTNSVQMIISAADGLYTNIQTGLITVTVPVAPVAGFSFSPAGGSTPLSVTFTDSSTGDITSRFWNFGDGATTNTTATSVTHTYTTAGTNTVSLIVSGPVGISTNVQASAVVVTAPVPPVAAFSASTTSGVAPLAVTFTDSSTGSITNRNWDFGDGMITNITTAGIVHTYTAAGSKTVRLIVSGPSGSSTNIQAGLITVDAAVSAGATNIQADAQDAYATGGTVRANRSETLMRIGQGGTLGVDFIQRGIIPFLLPALNAGESISAASLTFEVVSDTYANLSSNDKKMNIYAARVNSSPVVTGGDTTNGTLVASGVFDLNKDIVNGVYEVDLADLPAYLNSLYGSGSPAGQYLFLTLTPDADDARINSYVNVASADNTTATKPFLTLGIGSVSTQSSDSNGDGIADSWSTLYFGGPTNADPSALAANGINTIYETYVAGLNPTNAQSVFSVSNDWNTLHWTAASGRIYSVWATTNLQESFQCLESNILWPQNSWTGQFNGVNGFIRLEVELP